MKRTVSRTLILDKTGVYVVCFGSGGTTVPVHVIKCTFCAHCQCVRVSVFCYFSSVLSCGRRLLCLLFVPPPRRIAPVKYFLGEDGGGGDSSGICRGCYNLLSLPFVFCFCVESFAIAYRDEWIYISSYTPGT